MSSTGTLNLDCSNVIDDAGVPLQYITYVVSAPVGVSEHPVVSGKVIRQRNCDCLPMSVVNVLPASKRYLFGTNCFTSEHDSL